MSNLTLIIGNKNYSSWSLRPWFLMKASGLDFDEIRLPLYAEEPDVDLYEYSPSGKVPVLRHGERVVWDSLAICEYLNEQFPQVKGWPDDVAARAFARSVSAEVHSEFQALRHELPMNCRVRLKDYPLSEEVQQEVDRVIEIWNDCRRRFGTGGPWLFGAFSIADAMYAPVALRCLSYGIPLVGEAAAYRDQVLAHPAVQQWMEDGRQEYEVIERAEVRQPPHSH